MKLPHVTPHLYMSKNVAVVGSSSKLLESQCGAHIDSFDEVVRFNRAPTTGYEQWAGSKTTLRIVNGHVFMSRPFTRWREDEQFIKRLRNCKILLARDAHLATMRDAAIDKSVELYTVAESFRSLCSEFKDSLPTVGFMGILLLVSAGVKPTIFGWTTKPDEPMSHYFNRRSPTVSDCHRWELEMSILNDMIDAGDVIVAQR